MEKIERRRLKLQSAMEYMTTYGWMILVVAVALVALWSLGVFNLQSFTPKATSGACFVTRPNGPNTIAFISLSGDCTNQIPKYVSTFNGFGGSYVAINPPGGQKSTALTVTAWVYQNSYAEINSCQDVVSALNNEWAIQGPGYGTCAGTYPTAVVGGFSCRGSGSTGMPVKQWNFIAITWDNSNLVLYMNGVKLCSVAATGTIPTTEPVTIGNGYIGGSYSQQFNGSISNVQIYNTSLDSNTLSEMYYDGIGNDPTFINNLIGWWQLDGDTLDWSGNGDNGAGTNIYFNGDWYVGYNQP